MAEETKIPLPGEDDALKVPEFLKSDDWFDADIGPYRLNFQKAYEAPRYTLSWDGVPFAPLGGIHAITGQAGNGKTMTLAQFMAAILCGEYGELRCELDPDVPRSVLYIDTEMEEANTIAVKNRVMTLCGRPINEHADDFNIIMLREVPETIDAKGTKIASSTNRWRMTLKAIYEYRPTAVFIDGLLDVVKDFNDNKECQETIYKCMQVASHYGISVWCIVHQNPGGEKLVAFKFEGYWKDVGTIDSLWEANMDLLDENNELNLNDPTWRVYTEDAAPLPAYIGPDADIGAAYITQGTRVEGEVKNSVIFTGAEVGKGAHIIDSVLMPGVKVAEGATVTRALIANDIKVSKDAVVGSADSKEILLVAQDV